ncbi:MAG TPA: glycosyltransferase family 2 protein, partial [Thermoanaerobaculia bacterium]|nr:glycosyltransferase family 2 protein [Thermoanaerobaculia bacterium]
MIERHATLVVLAWNRWDLTRRCLDSLRQTDLSGADVVVVDNGSTDETPQALVPYTSWLRVIRNSRNLGFVGGNNVAIGEADPDSDVVLLNNDVEFRQSDWLQKLRRCAHTEPKPGIVGCRLILPDGRLLHAGTFIVPDTMWGQQIGSLEKDVGQFTRTREVDGIVFACAYLRREVLDRVGHLSADFESYFEDTDYCLRARRAGFKTYLCGDVTLIHNEHGSTTGDDGSFMRIFQASREVFRKKWARSLESRYKGEVLWQSIMNFPTGYAASTREILRALERRGVRASYRYVYGTGSPFPVAEPEGTGDYLMNVIAARNGSPAVGVVYGQGDVFHRNRGRRKVGFTMLEVDGFPSDWVRHAN